jgi:hypothetical protein
MRNKIIWSICVFAVILTLILPSIPANVTKQSNLTKDTTDEVYESGFFILLSSNIQGIDEGLHFGGMRDVNITATYQNTFLIRTKPIWGSAIILEDVDIQIQMKHFYGIVDIVGNAGEIFGICEDVSWKII